VEVENGEKSKRVSAYNADSLNLGCALIIEVEKGWMGTNENFSDLTFAK
jgi:hypothetical protein